jgi:hypothetical protein
MLSTFRHLDQFKMWVFYLLPVVLNTLNSNVFVSSFPLNHVITTSQPVKHSLIDHPAIADYAYVASQLSVVISEIQSFNVVNPRTEVFYRHAMETIETLRKADQEVLDGPDLGFLDWASFSPTLISLWLKIHQMAKAIQDKKGDIEATRTSLVFYSLLKQAHKESVRMKAGFARKLPSYMTKLTGGNIGEAVNKIEEVRDMFKPMGGDVDVVVITTSNNDGQQPQQWQGSNWQNQQGSQAPPQNVPQDYQNVPQDYQNSPQWSQNQPRPPQFSPRN